MSAAQTVAGIARVEAKLLFRSWGFRVFSVLTLLVLTLVMVTLVLAVEAGLYFSRALSGAFPLIVMKLLNVFQGIMAVFLATEFLKRDRKQDTTQVVFAQSFSNGQYVLGKFLGIFGVFLVLNLIVIIEALVIQAFFSQALFSGSSYLLYFALLNLPTLVFMIGLPMFLGSLIRSQAVVYLLTLSFIFVSLILIGPRFSFILDGFAYYTPVMYSDFIGLGLLSPLLLVRGAYFLLGAGLIMGAVVFMKRLRQSPVADRLVGFLAVFFTLGAAVLGFIHLRGVASDRSFREAIKAESRGLAGQPVMILQGCDLLLRTQGNALTVAADMDLINPGEVALNTIILSLNPGLRVGEVRNESKALSFRQDRHLITIEAGGAIAPGGSIHLKVSYAGTIDERYCYLDIGDVRRDEPLKIWLLSIPRRYAVVTPKFVHLTQESGWYPRPGLPEALLFPARSPQSFTRFTLTVEALKPLLAVSQGVPTVTEAGRNQTFVFKPETLLPQISLTIGRYEQKSLTVDGIRYALFLLEGHDRFTPKLADIAAELPVLIKSLRDQYEVLTGLPYPYRQFSLVEIPIQVTSFSRLWTKAQELVQPQIVFLPEMGVFNSGLEFRAAGRQNQAARPARTGQAGQSGQAARPAQTGPAGQAMRGGVGTTAPKDLQRALFNRFIRADLFGSLPAMAGAQRGGPLGIRIETNSEASFDIFPNFLTYVSPLDAAEWPLFGRALEAYLKERIGTGGLAAGAVRRFVQGMSSVQDDPNTFLRDHSLAEALRSPLLEPESLSSLLDEKGIYLLDLIRTRLGTADFDERLLGFLKDRRFQTIPKKSFEEFIAGLGRLDVRKTIADWYQEKGLPGFLFDKVETYRVLDGEKTKFQIKFEAANPTELEGIIKVSLTAMGGQGARGGLGGGMGVSAAAPETRMILLPPRTVKDVGLLLERASAMTTIDTGLSRNRPGVFVLPFGNQQVRSGVKPFDGELSRPYVPTPIGADGEYIVDNEDDGFQRPAKGNDNRLRRIVRRLFSSAADGPENTIPALMNPPEDWTLLVTQGFYGRFVRSAFIKKSGSGAGQVVWKADLRESGEYEIFFYYEGGGGGGGRGNMAAIGGGGPGGGQRGGGGQPGVGNPAAGQAESFAGLMRRRLQPGKKHFFILYEGRREEVVIDLQEARPGWNSIGKFRLPAGENRVELSDKNEGRYVTADAVKWVRLPESAPVGPAASSSRR